MIAQTTPPRVVIVGAGFGGLRAARALAKAPVQVTLIDRKNYHLFQPLLYQVATAGLSQDEIAYPVRSIFRRQKNFEFRMLEATDFDLAGKRLLTDRGAVDYDYLILAPGGETNYFGMDSLAANAFGLKDIDEASAIRNHLLQQFERASLETAEERRRERLTFVIAGGGPTGVECSGAISELIHIALPKDYPRSELDQMQVILLEAADRLLPAMPPELSEATRAVLEKKDVQVRFGAAVAGFDGHRVLLQDGASIAARTLIWAAGVRAVSLLEKTGLPLGSQQRVKVEPTLQATGHSEVYVIGDAALVVDERGNPLPMIAPVAMQQADAVARNIRRQLRGEPQQAFQYRDRGMMATIGRNQAVAVLGRLKFRGFLAWLVWVVVHIMQLVGYRNRLLVLINWAWDYLFYERAVRLIEPDRCRE